MSKQTNQHARIPLAAAVMTVLSGSAVAMGSVGGGYGYLGSRQDKFAPNELRLNEASTGLRDLQQHVSRTLNQAAKTVRQTLTDWAQSNRFEWTVAQSFAASADWNVAAHIRSQLIQGDFRSLPVVEIVDDHMIAPGVAAYRATDHRILLSSGLVQSNDPELLARIWLEEIGHGLDAQLSRQDSAGDEGEIFARLIQHIIVPAPEMALLRAQKDAVELTMNGQPVSLELATFNVTNNNDSGAGSLRQAILDANGAAGADTITFSGALNITLTSGELLVTESVSIEGDTDANAATRNIVIDAGGNSRVFNFTSGSTNSSIDNLEITGGSLAGDGGDLSNGGAAAGTPADVHGAGIFNEGTLEITNSTIDGNGAGAGGGGAPGNGGGGGFSGIAGSTGGDGGNGAYGATGSSGAANSGGNGASHSSGQGGFGGTTSSGGAGGNSSGSGSDGGAGGTAGTAAGGGGAAGYTPTGQDGGFGANASGGIYNSGILTISDSTITNNLGAGGGGGGSGAAGGNGAVGGDGGNAAGGIYNSGGGTLTIDPNTIASFSGNVGGAGSGGLGGNTNGANGTAENDIFGAYTVSGGEQTFEVDNSGDIVDGNYAAGQLTLREALNQINPNDTITFAAALDGATITTSSTLTIAGGQSVTIDGDLNDDMVADVSVSGSNTHTVFEIQSGAVATIDGLNIINGAATGSVGADGTDQPPSAPQNSGVNGGDADPGENVGGGIYNAGNLTVENSNFMDNSAIGGVGGEGGYGGDGGEGTAGGGYGYGAGRGGFGGYGGHAGGGILNASGGTLSVTNSYFSGNSAIGGAGGTGGEGGMAGNSTSNGTNSRGGGSSGGGGAGGYGGSAASAILNLGVITGDATVDVGDTKIEGAGGTGGDGGQGGTGASPSGPGTGATGGAGGTGGAAETSGSAGSPGNTGDNGASGGSGGAGGVFDLMSMGLISQAGSGGPIGDANNSSGDAGGGGGAGGGAGGLNGGASEILNVDTGSGSITETTVPVELQSFEIE